MKKTLLVLHGLVSMAFSSFAQTHCSETIPTNASTLNLWDWRSKYWDVYYITTSGLGTYYNMNSPFYDAQNQNVEQLADKDEANKDFKPEDGWELIKKDLGTPVQATTNPFVVLYNKYTARLRVFFLVTQLYSEVGTTDAQKGGIIKVGFVDGAKDFSYAYQSNVLTAYTAPIIPLDQFKRDIVINTPNLFRSTLPYWLYADVPVAYDPCTCQSKGKMYIRAELINTAQVDITIKSLPYQAPVKDNAVNANSDFLTSFGKVGDKLEGGVKAANSAGEAINKLGGALVKLLDKADKDNESDYKFLYERGLADLSKSTENTGNWLSLISGTFKATKSVVALVDYFVSGGKSSTNGAAPSPVMIMNDFKVAGNITSQYQKNKVTFAIPGSNQTGMAAEFRPSYNNVLGIFNLTETPRLKSTTYNKYDRYVSPTSRTPGTYIGLLGQTVTYQLEAPLKYVLNPALSIDYTLSDIQAAFVFTSNKGAYSGDMGLATIAPRSNLVNEGTGSYRTHYFPINGLARIVVKNFGQPYKCGYKGASTCYWNYLTSPKLKIVARFKRKNSTKENEDIVFIATYPVKTSTSEVNYLEKNATPAGLQWNWQDYPQDYVIPDNKTYNVSSQVYAHGTVTLGKNMVLTNNAKLNIFAAGGVIVPAGVTVPSNVIISTTTTPRDLWPIESLLPQAPLNTSEVAAFCNGSTYKITNRFQASRKSPEEKIGEDEPQSFMDTYPNPTHGLTTIKYSLVEKASVNLYITDMVGRKIASLAEEKQQESGEHIAEFDTANLPAGIYLYTIETVTFKKTKRLIVIK